MNPKLGCCYYPEHWPESQWQSDAQRMKDLGLTWVRLAEFAWSRLEPSPDNFEFDWLDRAIETLAEQGLKVVMCTPTATPPRWMLDKHPDMLAVDIEGRPRGFGSRRHYCFSHLAYRQEACRIAEIVADRYANHEAVQAWQLDNEYSCHDTARSYSEAARRGFRNWLSDKYESVGVLNEAWGNIFWSMEYDDFDQIDLPNLTVTEANPSHWLDFYRYSSDQVVAFNKAQADVLRKHTDAPLIHNYMGRIVDFDHYKVGADLDIASWDSYPLGFLVDRLGASEEWQRRFERQGDPDLQAFHHDLYRAVGRGRWWVMEQQPGPVNWAPNNPAPLPGMVRLWTFEAIAHEAEAVCYFRWRQAPFAQEQMHAGLLRPDSQPSAVFPEVEQTSKEIQVLGDVAPAKAEVALIFDYESCWAWETQPQGEAFDEFSLALDFYRALRGLGLTIDVVAPDHDLSQYKLVLIPGLFAWPDNLLQRIESHPGLVFLGPRSGSKTKNFQIPTGLAPSIPGLDVIIAYVESFKAGNERPLSNGGAIKHWCEAIETTEDVIETTVDGAPVLVRKNRLFYLGAWLDSAALGRVLKAACDELGITTTNMPEGIRQRTTASHRFVFNHNAHAHKFEGEELAPAQVKITALD